MTSRRVKALAAIVLLVALVWLGFWLAHVIHEREECGGLGPSVCRGLRESDERECHAGEGCGQPRERKGSS